MVNKMYSCIKSHWLIILLTLLSNNLFSQESSPDNFGSKKSFLKEEKKIRFSYQWQHDTITPGGNTTLALVIDFDKWYHIYPPSYLIPANYPEQLIASKVKVSKISDKANAQSPIFLAPGTLYLELLKKDIICYKDQTFVFVPIKVDPSFSEEKLIVSLEMFYQMCNEKSCFAPKTETITAEILINKNGSVKQINESIFSQMPMESSKNLTTKEHYFGYSNWKFYFDAKSTIGFFLMVFMAFIGGALLNFTPCVLPIIPIKIMGLSHSAGSRKKSIFLGLVMSTGIISFWLVMGFLISSVSKFSSISKLYQYPAFTITVGIIIAIMAVGMCGLFNIQVPQKIAVLNPKFNSTLGSFGIGIMTAILSTPCTAPFMGSATAWALKQSQQTTLLIFFSIGLGMALPYFILSSFPVLVRWVPKSGPVSVVIKETMGILMMAAASYFIGVGLTNYFDDFKGSSNYWWPTMLMVAFTGIFIIFKTFQLKPNIIKKTIFTSIGILIIIVSLLTLKSMTAIGTLQWQDYTPELLEKSKNEKKIVVIDFTAEWCLNCKALEKYILNSNEVSTVLTNQNIVLIKVDLSNNDEVKTKLLNAEGSLTIPYLVIYKNGQKVFQSDFYSKEDILKVITTK